MKWLLTTLAIWTFRPKAMTATSKLQSMNAIIAIVTGVILIKSDQDLVQRSPLQWFYPLEADSFTMRAQLFYHIVPEISHN